jgi:enoyl-CoA hydratase/carnithine racemase
MTAPTGVSPRERRWLAHLGRRALDAIEQLDAVTIARVHGHAIGGGLLLALACDFRISAEGTTFFFPEVELGTPLDWRGVPRLIREIGLARAREVVMMSKRFMTAEAERYGILNQVVAPEQLDETIAKWAAALTAKPDAAILLSKAQFRAYGATLTLGDSAEFEAELLLQTLGSEVARAAFRSK